MTENQVMYGYCITASSEKLSNEPEAQVGTWPAMSAQQEHYTQFEMT